jgi:hypothetical protein
MVGYDEARQGTPEVFDSGKELRRLGEKEEGGEG